MTQPDTPQSSFTTNIFGDSYLPSINGKNFEEIAYSTYFDIEILDQLSKEFTFYIFIGTDSGMMLKHLQLLNTDPSSIYLFIEDADRIKYIEVNRVQTIKSFSAQEQTYLLYITIAQQIHEDINQLKSILGHILLADTEGTSPHE